MGRKSTKENKNVYQQAREDRELTREAAALQLEFISDDRIEKIESDKVIARPEEVMKMAECYKHPELCNYYCSHECPIGQRYVPEVGLKELSQISLEMLASLNALEKQKNRLIEIAVDGIVHKDEKEDFIKIRDQLEEMSKAISALTIWVDNAVNTGKIE